MNRHLYIIVLAVGILALSTGCYQLDHLVTVNPNGSAKIQLSVTLDIPEDEERFREADIKEARENMEQIFSFLQHDSKGVDAWTPYDVKQSADGKTRGTATAYVPDLSKYRQAIAEGYELTSFLYEWSEGEDGESSVEVKLVGFTDWSGRRPDVPELTDDELREEMDEVLKMGSEMELSNENTTNYFENLRLTTSIRVPGEITEVHNLANEAPNEVQMTIEGNSWAKSMHHLFNDEDLVKQMVQNIYRQYPGGLGPIRLPAPVMNEVLFGEKAPAIVKFNKASTALFDYEKEVAEAKLAFEEWKKERPEREEDEREGFPVPRSR